MPFVVIDTNGNTKILSSAAAVGVTSVTGGAGVTASPTTGAVVLANTGVTSAIATAGKTTVSSATGAVTIGLGTDVPLLDANNTFTAILAAAGQFSLSPLVPGALGAGINNDYNPVGLATASILELTPNGGGSTLTGITAQPNGTVLGIVNTAANGGARITIAFENVNSLAANRFFLGGLSASIDLIPGAVGTVTFCYYSTNKSRWMFI